MHCVLALLLTAVMKPLTYLPRLLAQLPAKHCEQARVERALYCPPPQLVQEVLPWPVGLQLVELQTY